MAVVENRLIKGSYQLTAFIEETPLCLVYRGEILTTRAPLLIKLYKKENLGDSFNDAAQKILPKIEALNHPCILKVYDHHLAHEGLYEIGEYPAGKNLADHVRDKGPLTLAETLEIAQQIGAALAYAQENGLLHGSLAPEKIYVGPKNQIKISDFALVDFINQSNIARANVILTEATYLAPEQIRGGLTTSATDVYALGLLLYFMLKGQPPFTGETNTAVALKHLRAEPPPVPADQAPGWLAEIIRQSLAKDSAARFRQPLEIVQIIRNNLPPAPAAAGAAAGAAPPASANIKKDPGETIVEPPSKIRMPEHQGLPLSFILLLVFLLVGSAFVLYKKVGPRPQPQPLAQTAPAPAAVQNSPGATTTAKGNDLKAAPNLVGLTLKQARELLTSSRTSLELQGISGLSLDDFSKKPIDRQEPAANIQPAPAAIKVWLKAAPEQTKNDLPSLIGSSLSNAQKELERAGFTRQRVIIQKTKNKEQGLVRWQSPAGRTEYAADSLVTLAVGGGNSGTAAPIKAQQISFQLPASRFPWEVTVKVLDSQGEFTVGQGIFVPGSRIELPLVGVGDAIAKVYLNGNLVQEWGL